MVVGIIGAGASGMAAALSASENASVQVLLFERQARVGRKLQATGNGRCNLTNMHADTQGLHGQNAGFPSYAISHFGVAQTLHWFSSLGLYTVAEESGRVYPYSDQANSVVDVLRFALQRDNITLISGFEVAKVKKTADGFRIEGNDKIYTCDRLIVACGGLAGTKLGGSMSGYQLLRSFGHHITKLRPSLVQLKSSWSGCAALKGVRTQCAISVLNGDHVHAKSIGELQFTDYGLSGPVVFEVSRDACFEKGNWHCVLDFLPNMDQNTLFSLLDKRRSGTFLTDDLFTGILHNRLGRVLTQAAGIRNGIAVSSLRDDEIHEAVIAAKTLDVTITEPMGMEHAQVTAGGACTDEFDSQTMESRVVPGLFACGEVLDVDGDCGGYNLQWAWSSGRLAGMSAGGEK